MDIGRKNRAADAIRDLAMRYDVHYHPTSVDRWAEQVTRLAGDDVDLDDVEFLLIALQRAGHLSRPDALRLQVNYLRESRS